MLRRWTTTTMIMVCTTFMATMPWPSVHGFSQPTKVRPVAPETQEAKPKTIATKTTIIPKEEPPMAIKWPIVGTLPDFYARGGVDGLRDVYESMYTDYGPVFGMSFLGQEELVLSNPYVYDTVLRNEGKVSIGVHIACMYLGKPLI